MCTSSPLPICSSSGPQQNPPCRLTAACRRWRGRHEHGLRCGSSCRRRPVRLPLAAPLRPPPGLPPRGQGLTGMRAPSPGLHPAAGQPWWTIILQAGTIAAARAWTLLTLFALKLKTGASTCDAAGRRLDAAWNRDSSIPFKAGRRPSSFPWLWVRWIVDGDSGNLMNPVSASLMR